jgi:hypothetical protein
MNEIFLFIQYFLFVRKRDMIESEWGEKEKILLLRTFLSYGL